ncbi:MAG: SagB/ThcOx family dehydrogenase [bacterium]|nr:SagB/ThcOx family dehydrogenase [bacterium]
MMRRLTLAFIIAVLAGGAIAEEAKLRQVALPKPQTDAGKPLMQALRDRRSERDFSDRALPPQLLSNLLWAAFGVNRPDSGKRTAPSAMNMQEIEVYAATRDGLYLYNAKEHRLDPVKAGDIRAQAGVQDFVKTAPAVLIFVADHGRMRRLSDADRDFYAAVDTGYISQNVYLFCASEGLSTVALGWVEKPKLAAAMGLPEERKVVLTQPVGYPKR